MTVIFTLLGFIGFIVLLSVGINWCVKQIFDEMADGIDKRTDEECKCTIQEIGERNES